MNSRLRVQLQITAEQRARLMELQRVFAAACNHLAPLVQSTTCWNRVALHHMAYKDLRQKFPELGSQMVCNAIYSVSRACRLVYQHPQSPFHLQRLAGKPLPRLQFSEQSPVYFDRHTLSLKDGKISMLTLDGRMRFNVPLGEREQAQFRDEKLREIVMMSEGQGLVLHFSFAAPAQERDRVGVGAAMHPSRKSAAASAAPVDADVAERGAPVLPDSGELPEYLLVIDNDGPSGSPGASTRTPSSLFAAAPRSSPTQSIR